MVRKSKEAISISVLPLANWFIKLKRLDLYNKSRVRGDFQARFCERLGAKFPLPTRLSGVVRHKVFLLFLANFRYAKSDLAF